MSPGDLFELYKEVEDLENDQDEPRRAVKDTTPAVEHTPAPSPSTSITTALVKLDSKDGNTKSHRRIFAVVKRIRPKNKGDLRQIRQRRLELTALLKEICSRKLTLCRFERFKNPPLLENSLENAGASFDAMLSKAMGDIETDEHKGQAKKAFYRYGVVIRVNDTLDDYVFPQRPIKRRITFLKDIRRMCSKRFALCDIVPDSELPSGLRQPSTTSLPVTGNPVSSDKTPSSTTAVNKTKPPETTQVSKKPSTPVAPTTTPALTSKPSPTPSTPSGTKVDGKNTVFQSDNSTQLTYLLGILHEAGVSKTVTAHQMKTRRVVLLRRLRKLCTDKLTMCSLLPLKDTQQVVIRDKHKNLASNLIEFSPDRNLGIIKRVDDGNEEPGSVKLRQLALLKRLKSLCTHGLNRCFLKLVKNTEQVIVRNKNTAVANQGARFSSARGTSRLAEKSKFAAKKDEIDETLQLVKAIKVIMKGKTTTTTKKPTTIRRHTVRYEQMNPKVGKVVKPVETPYYAGTVKLL